MASNIVISNLGDVTIVRFVSASILDGAAVGEIATELYALVDQRAIRKLVLDFENVRFLSSQMLGVLIALHKKSLNIKGKFVLAGLRPELMKVFKITKLDKILLFADDESKAMKHFDALAG